MSTDLLWIIGGLSLWLGILVFALILARACKRGDEQIARAEQIGHPQ